MGSESIVVVDRVSRNFGAVAALSNVSLKVATKQTFALLGPNGSGKSTLLRMLCGYLHPSSGEIRIAGYSMSRSPGLAKTRLSYVPDESDLYGRMRVRQFLRFMAGVKRLPRKTISNRIELVVKQLALQSVFDDKINHLSRGFRQRVAIAQALLNEPQVILLDEPTNGLDPVQIREWRQLVTTLSATCTVIFTSHVLDDVVALADRVGLLVGGELRTIATLETGTTREELEALFFAALSATAETV